MNIKGINGDNFVPDLDSKGFLVANFENFLLGQEHVHYDFSIRYFTLTIENQKTKVFNR